MGGLWAWAREGTFGFREPEGLGLVKDPQGSGGEVQTRSDGEVKSVNKATALENMCAFGGKGTE